MSNENLKKTITISPDNYISPELPYSDNYEEFETSPSLPLFRSGERFCTVSSLSVANYVVDKDGRPVVELSSSMKKLDYQLQSSLSNKIFSEIIEIDSLNKTFTAILHFNDHDSKRIFKSSIYNYFVKHSLLNDGQKFYIITTEIEKGLQIEFEEISNDYDDEVRDFLKIFNQGGC